MGRDRSGNGTPAESVISIIGPGMKVVGDCETDGTVRIDGQIQGSVSAGKAVVVGKEGIVDGDIDTQDAVVSGRVTGKVRAESRLELQATSRVDGEIHARRLQLEEGAILNGSVQMSDRPPQTAGAGSDSADEPAGAETPAAAPAK